MVAEKATSGTPSPNRSRLSPSCLVLNGKTRPKTQRPGARRPGSGRAVFLPREPACGLKAGISKMTLSLKKTYFSNYCFLSHVTKLTAHRGFKAEI